MDSHPFASRTVEPSREKRIQRYQHFAFQPGDEELIPRLPVHQQTILRSQGSYEQRAKDLGIAIGTVRSQLHRARAALEKLRQQAGDVREDAGEMDREGEQKAFGDRRHDH